MTVYLDLVCIINFVVDFLLLLGTNRLCGYPPSWTRISLAAALGGIYGGICLFPRLYFLGNPIWRVIVLGLMSMIAFGISISGARRGMVFVLLSMALGGISVGIGNASILSLIAALVGVCILSFSGFRHSLGSVTYVPVELSYGDCRLHLIALQDTGNALKDPITGKSILVVSSDAAQKLTGLTVQQLRSPVKAISEAILPGLRLVPYQAIGQSAGLLLAMRLQNVKIGKWQGSSLVAFAPDGLSREGAYQALTGVIL